MERGRVPDPKPYTLTTPAFSATNARVAGPPLLPQTWVPITSRGGAQGRHVLVAGTTTASQHGLVCKLYITHGIFTNFQDGDMATPSRPWALFVGETAL